MTPKATFTIARLLVLLARRLTLRYIDPTFHGALLKQFDMLIQELHRLSSRPPLWPPTMSD